MSKRSTLPLRVPEGTQRIGTAVVRWTPPAAASSNGPARRTRTRAHPLVDAPAPSNVLSFVVLGTPVPKARARFARIGDTVQTFTPAKTAAYEAHVRTAAVLAMNGAGPFRGPVRLDISIFVAMPKGWSKKRRALAIEGIIGATRKPDADNILKALKDGMNRVVYLDDAQVTEIHAFKCYGVEPRVEISVGPTGASAA